MARPKKQVESTDLSKTNDMDAYAQELMDQLNAEAGEKTFLNLAKDDAATNIKRWISTGSDLLDWICSGRPNGGFPDGKLIEISGPESVGKSHIAYQVAKNVQQMGGITLYIDTESATARENLSALGIDFSKRFIYAQRDNIESVITTIEQFVKKTAQIHDKVPLCVIWDSIGGISSSIDLDRDIDESQQPGIDAKQIKRGLNKLMNTVGYSKILFLIINQQYTLIGAEKWEKQTSTKGGKGLRYAASIRLELDPRMGGMAFVYPNDIEHAEAMKAEIPSVGIRVKAKTIKNKISSPFRSCEFEIHFGVGIKDHYQKFDLLSNNSPINLPDGRKVEVSGGAWKSITVTKDGNEILNDKFRKLDIEEKMTKGHKALVKECIDVVMEKRMKVGSKQLDFDSSSFEEFRALEESVQEIKNENHN